MWLTSVTVHSIISIDDRALSSGMRIVETGNPHLLLISEILSCGGEILKPLVVTWGFSVSRRKAPTPGCHFFFADLKKVLSATFYTLLSIRYFPYATLTPPR